MSLISPFYSNSPISLPTSCHHVHLPKTQYTHDFHTPTSFSFFYSHNIQISEAYRRFGITPSSKHLIIAKVLITPQTTLTPSALNEHLLAHVKGMPVPFTDEALQAEQLTDWAKVRKYYKLNNVGWLDGVKDETEKRREMEVLVLGGMALRGL